MMKRLLRGEEAQRRPDRLRRERLRHRAALRLGDRQPQHSGERDAGQAGGIERHPPAIVLVDVAADEIAEEDAEIGADGVDAERARALVLVEEIGDHRLRGGRAGGFADADADPRQRQRRRRSRHAAQHRHRAPERKGDRDDVAAVEPVGDARDGNAEQRIEQHEAEAREQAHHGVAELKLLLDRLDQDVEDRAVEEVQRVDDGEQPQHVIAPRRGLCGGVRLHAASLLARHRPWFPPADFTSGRVSASLTPRECNSPLRIRPAARLRIERDADRIAACGHRLELVAQHAPDHQDAAVALAEMLLGMDASPGPGRPGPRSRRGIAGAPASVMSHQNLPLNFERMRPMSPEFLTRPAT